MGWLYETLGTLRSDDGDGSGNATKAIGLISKTTILHVHHAFLYISLLSLHDYDVKMPNFTLTEEVHKRRRNFLSLSELEYGSEEFTFRRVNLRLKKLVTWSNRDEDWKNANSLFQRLFLCRRCPRILRSLFYWQAGHPTKFYKGRLHPYPFTYLFL